MPRQEHEARYPHALAEVFAALSRVVGRRRWGAFGADADPAALPKVGCRYAQKTGSMLRCGSVIESVRPVSLTLAETLHDPPCHVRLKLRWRLYAIDSGSLLRLTLHYELGRASSLRRRHWHDRLAAHCARLLSHIAADLEKA